VVAPTEDSSYPELEKLVNEIKQGKRIVLHPVGGLSFVAVIMVLIVSFVTLSAPLISVIGSDWEIDTRGSAQFFAMLVGAFFIFFSAFIAISAAISIVTVYLLNIEISQFDLMALFISLATASLATYLAQSARYRAFTYFRFFLHRKD